MRSKTKDADPFASVDFERDVQITAADIEALARARDLPSLLPTEYMEWVELIARHHPDAVSREGRGNIDSDEPFTLPD
jgi:hypothetical protein